MAKTKIMLIKIVLIVLFLGCNSNKEKINGEVLNIRGINSTIKQIENQGFKLIPDDIIIYEKKIKDTLVIVNFHRDFKDIAYISWKINLKDSSKSYVLNYLTNRNFTMISPFTDTSSGYYFTAIRREKENVILSFNVENYQDSDALSITYYKPRAMGNGAPLPYE